MFAKEQKIDLVDEKYFFTQERWDALQKVLKEEKEKKPLKSPERFPNCLHRKNRETVLGPLEPSHLIRMAIWRPGLRPAA